MRSAAVADLDGVVEELRNYRAEFAPVFQRSEQRGWAGVHVEGLLTAEVPRKNMEAVAVRRYRAGRKPVGEASSVGG